MFSPFSMDELQQRSEVVSRISENQQYQPMLGGFYVGGVEPLSNRGLLGSTSKIKHHQTLGHAEARV